MVQGAKNHRATAPGYCRCRLKRPEEWSVHPRRWWRSSKRRFARKNYWMTGGKCWRDDREWTFIEACRCPYISIFPSMALETAVSLRLYEWKQPREETKSFSGRWCWHPYESNPSLVLQSKLQMDADLKDRVFEEFNSLLGGHLGQECIQMIQAKIRSLFNQQNERFCKHIFGFDPPKIDDWPSSDQ